MSEPTQDREHYDAAVLQVRYEGQLLWQRFGAFLLPHSVFLAFVLNSASAGQIGHYSFRTFWSSVVGFLLCVPWLAVYMRSSAYYSFRIAQAREIEPAGWHLFGGKARDFSAGKNVTVSSENRRMPWLARRLRTEQAGWSMIFVFFLVYLAVVVASGPWWPRVNGRGHR